MLTFVGRRIFLVAGATDMRRSFNGLSGLARELLCATPESRDLFVFCNAGQNRLKVLVYDESGVWLLAKRLDCGTFAWPRESDAGSVVEYREEQLTLLLRGFDSEVLRPRRWRRRAMSSSPKISSSPMELRRSRVDHGTRARAADLPARCRHREAPR